MDRAQAYEKLKKYGQEHVLRYYDELSGEEKNALLSQIEDTDFSILAHAAHPHVETGKGKVTPLGALELDQIRANGDRYRAAGLKAIREGKVGAVLLAGGMGTRLGSDDPKCMYDIGITHPVYIMERLISNLKDVVREAGVTVPLFVMTS